MATLGQNYTTAPLLGVQTADNVSITGGNISGVTISGASLNDLGNATVGGALQVTGASTLTGAITGSATLNLVGNETVGGTLSVSGASSLAAITGTTVTANTSVTTPSLLSASGAIIATPANSIFEVANAGNPLIVTSNTAAGADSKNAGWGGGSGNVSFGFYSDNFGALTTAYTIARGTTYNVANHTWYTSTVAGTAVQTLALSMASSKTNLVGTWPTSAAGLATGTLWNNAGVLNVA